MTCIIGYIDKKEDCVWIGADSLGSNGFTKSIEGQPKVFRHELFENVIMGSTSTFRHIDLLRYSKNLFNEIDWYKKEPIDHKYMVTKFIPNCIDLFEKGIKSEKDIDKGAHFIVGADNQLFEIQADYSVLTPLVGFTAVGCGEYAAIASMLTTKDMDMTVPEKIRIALEVCETACCGVQRPFKIINTKTKKELIID